MVNAIDLYSGIGGWTMGMKLSGIRNIASYEWWSEANNTHNQNFGTNHREVDIRQINPKSDLIFNEKIQFVVGSPPCTQFSFANRGGNGDIVDGLVDIFKFLEVVEVLKPKYWAMENVPRVAKILEKELSDGSLQRFKHLVKAIMVVDAADYGTPQSRKRMIAGDFPKNLFESYKGKIEKVTLGEVLNSLNQDLVVDPNYGYTIERDLITELENEVDLTGQELRINKDSKAFHPVYNKMAFPDKLNRPSRTVTATCTRVSRESIIVRSQTGFRRLNVRERGVIQGFPITYQFYGKTLNSKFKMIGNAVPPILTYYIFQSMLEVPSSEILTPKERDYFHEKPISLPPFSNLGLPISKYPLKRKFQFAVPNLRFGSGVRFELSNDPKQDSVPWSFKFFYGNSKKIRELALDQETIEAISPWMGKFNAGIFGPEIDFLEKKYSVFNSSSLQEKWVNSNPTTEIFEFLDEIGEVVSRISERVNFDYVSNNQFQALLDHDNKKLIENKDLILLGVYLLSILNLKILSK